MKMYLVEQHKKHEYGDTGWNNTFGIFDDRLKAEEAILSYLQSISLTPVKKWDEVCKTKTGFKISEYTLMCFSIEEYELNCLRQTA